MLLIGLSGHSGAGKSRLTAALPEFGLSCPRVVLYTSRRPRVGEMHGRDYYFLSRGAIAAFPETDFFVGPVREMLQAVDLAQLEADLLSNDIVLVEIFHALWPGLKERIKERLGDELRMASVFMTAINPAHLLSLPDDETRADHIRREVEGILVHRKKDPPAKIPPRAESAVKEIMIAIRPDSPYDKVFHSAPEGPDGEDEWTCKDGPINQARQVLFEFIEFVRTIEYRYGELRRETQ